MNDSSEAPNAFPNLGCLTSRCGGMVGEFNPDDPRRSAKRHDLIVVAVTSLLYNLRQGTLVIFKICPIEFRPTRG